MRDGGRERVGVERRRRTEPETVTNVSAFPFDDFVSDREGYPSHLTKFLNYKLGKLYV
jgi:hypothetical protein